MDISSAVRLEPNSTHPTRPTPLQHRPTPPYLLVTGNVDLSNSYFRAALTCLSVAANFVED
jgi:hypothetical protein